VTLSASCPVLCRQHDLNRERQLSSVRGESAWLGDNVSVCRCGCRQWGDGGNVAPIAFILPHPGVPSHDGDICSRSEVGPSVCLLHSLKASHHGGVELRGLARPRTPIVGASSHAHVRTTLWHLTVAATPGHDRRKAKRPATKNRNSLDSVTSVGSGVGALLGTIFSPVYNWATGAADLGLQSPSAEAAAATVRENNASDATTVSTYTVAANVQEDDDLYAFDPWDFIRRYGVASPHTAPWP
jgi:hypothetical protein